jgi:hypothetical protein
MTKRIAIVAHVPGRLASLVALLAGQKAIAMPLEEYREYERRAARRGFVLKDGVFQCAACGPHNCGQCGDSIAGLTMAEFRD